MMALPSTWAGDLAARAHSLLGLSPAERRRLDEVLLSAHELGPEQAQAQVRAADGANPCRSAKGPSRGAEGAGAAAAAPAASMPLPQHTAAASCVRAGAAPPQPRAPPRAPQAWSHISRRLLQPRHALSVHQELLAACYAHWPRAQLGPHPLWVPGPSDTAEHNVTRFLADFKVRLRACA